MRFMGGGMGPRVLRPEPFSSRCNFRTSSKSGSSSTDMATELTTSDLQLSRLSVSLFTDGWCSNLEARSVFSSETPASLGQQRVQFGQVPYIEQEIRGTAQVRGAPKVLSLP